MLAKHNYLGQQRSVTHCVVAIWMHSKYNGTYGRNIVLVNVHATRNKTAVFAPMGTAEVAILYWIKGRNKYRIAITMSVLLTIKLNSAKFI